MAAARYNLLNPTGKPRISHVAQCLDETEGPIVAATDYVRAFAEQIRAYVPRRYVVLGTDGFGRSDTRAKLRRFFEVDRYYIAVAALWALAEEGVLPPARVIEAMRTGKWDIVDFYLTAYAAAVRAEERYRAIGEAIEALQECGGEDGDRPVRDCLMVLEQLH